MKEPQYIQGLLVGKYIISNTFKNLNDFNNRQKDFVIVSNPDEIPEDSQIEGKRIYINLNIPENINNDELYCLKSEAMASLFGSVVNGDVDLFWCFNAGKGATELLLCLIDNPNIQNIPKEKVLIGFSDNTELGIYLNRKYGWKMLHAPILSQITDNYLSEIAKCDLINSLSNLLYDGHTTIEHGLKVLYISDDVKNHIFNHSIEKTSVVGGNAALIQTTLASDWQIDTQGKILFIEDICSVGTSYVLERTISSMINSHLFDDIKALIIGDLKFDTNDIMTKEKMHDRIINLLKINSLNKFSSGLKYPIFSLELIGHHPNNRVLPLYSDDSKIYATTIDNVCSYTLSVGISIN